LEPFIENIAKCVGDSFENPEDYESNNRILADDKIWGGKHNLIAHPSILINDFTYRGDIDYRDLKQAICSAYKVRPDNCNISAALEDAENINIYKSASFFKRFRMVFRATHLFIIGLAIVLCNVCLIIVIRRYGAKKQSDRIN
jgi:hypothetical protein